MMQMIYQCLFLKSFLATVLKLPGILTVLEFYSASREQIESNKKNKRLIILTEINKFFPKLNQEKKEKYYKLIQLYKYWNSKVNLISRKDIDNLEINHILHSLSIAKIVSFKDSTSVLDVGTGGGLPGIPLAIFFQKLISH